MLRLHAIGFAAVLAAAGAARGQDAVPPAPGLAPVAARLETMIAREMKDKNLPAVSVALVNGREIVWAKGFGLARPKEKVPATARTLYRVGSVSKLFTDLAAMQLVEQGKLDLDAETAKALPGFAPKNPFGGPITVRQLMSHRSGICREPPVGHYFDPASPTLEATVKSLNDTDLVFAPGARTKYSNAGVSVVGRVVEALRGEPFAASVKKTVLDPLGMSTSGFVLTPEMSALAARGEMWTYDGRTFDAPTFPLGTNAAGELYSSVLDLGKFLGAVLDGGKGRGAPVVKAETMEAMFEPQFPGRTPPGTRAFGLGFMVSQLDNRRKVGHGGAVYGFATDVSALPDDGLGVAVVVTKDCANAVATHIADTALRLMLAAKHDRPLPAEEVPSEPLPPGLARQLAGRYGSGESAVELTESAGRLYMTPDRGGYRVELRRKGKNLVVDDALARDVKVSYDDDRIVVAGRPLARAVASRPSPAPERWAGLIGEYGWDHDVLYVLERGGKLYALIEWFEYDPLEEVGPDLFKFPDRGLYVGETLKFTRDASGRTTKVVAANVEFLRRKIDGDDGSTFRIQPVRPVAELRPEALAARPPAERGEFRKPELVDVPALEPSVELDVRYATTNNFLSTPFYTSARAFLQRPAAEALLKAHAALEADGFGLLIHDAYRPWHVTRMFWDATPQSGRGFVADPSKGSRHNRGCAVDLTLYDRDTGKAVEMVGGYDEFSPRSAPDYPGGTSLQRWRRDRLRRAMEDQGFTVNEVEWWHFDYRDWPKYPILNLTFDMLDREK